MTNTQIQFVARLTRLQGSKQRTQGGIVLQDAYKVSDLYPEITREFANQVYTQVNQPIEVSKRRTKLQMAHDSYCRDVDQYKWFIINLETNKIQVGYESKYDATENLAEDYEGINAKVIPKRVVAKYGINIEEILNQWKSC